MYLQYTLEMRSNYFILLFIVCSSLSAFGQRQLGYKLKVGDKFSLVQKANQEITQEMDGTTHIMNNIIEGSYYMTVLRTTEAGYIIGFSFEHFKMEATSNLAGVIMDIDTQRDADKDDIQSMIFNGLIGVEMEMEMLKTGKIIAITGTDKLISSMIEGSGIADQTTKREMYRAMEEEFGGGTLAASFEQLTYIYPETKVRIGDRWKNSINGELNADNTWTYQGKANKQNTITGLSDIALNNETDGMTMKLTGMQETKVICDAKNGFILSFNAESEGSGDSFIVSLGDTPIPTKITTITEYFIK